MTQEKALTILKTGANVFLTGGPGAGKTHVINLFCDFLNSRGIPYAVTASTGIAATHINGTTIHSFSGLGIKEKVTDVDLRAIGNKPYAVRQIQRPRVLIIDEISMIDASVLDNVEKILTYIRGTNMSGEPFGGLQVIFVGDFYQLPPVSKTRQSQFAFNSNAWNLASPVTCYITEQHRQTDPTFTEILNCIREGTATKEMKKILIDNKGKKVPKTQLFTHNADVDSVNHKELKRIEGEVYEFKMHSSGNEFLVETLKKNCLSPDTLYLKKGALVMFTRNNFDEGYVNGTIGTVVDIDTNGILIETESGQIIELLERAEWYIGEPDRKVASIHQYPLRLAWAITVHKSQGMSLDSAVIDLSKSFEYGQGYVALSRVCSLEGLYLEGANAKAFEMHPEVVLKDKEFRASSELMDAKF